MASRSPRISPPLPSPPSCVARAWMSAHADGSSRTTRADAQRLSPGVITRAATVGPGLSVPLPP